MHKHALTIDIRSIIFENEILTFLANVIDVLLRRMHQSYNWHCMFQFLTEI